jgi:hypothetical protein
MRFGREGLRYPFDPVAHPRSIQRPFMVTNPPSGTNVFEIAPGIYRINTPVSIPGGPEFNFNQYLIADDEPLVLHTGPRRMFPLVREAIERVMPIDRLR